MNREFVFVSASYREAQLGQECTLGIVTEDELRTYVRASYGLPYQASLATHISCLQRAGYVVAEVIEDNPSRLDPRWSD